MKSKNLLILIFLVFGYKALAQINGVPFAPNGTRWSTETYFKTGFQTQVHYYSNFLINGDTIINNKRCQKLFALYSKYFDSTCFQYVNNTYYYNRQFFIDTVLLYDFNLNVGDTFNLFINDGPCLNQNGYYKMPVDSVDSVYYGNKWRKKIVFKEINFQIGSVRWVEGIGDIDYGISSNGYNFYGEVAGHDCLLGYDRLNCFQEPDYSTIGSNCFNGSCSQGISEIKSISLYLYPNPFSNHTNIQSSENLKKANLTIFNSLGKEVRYINNIGGKEIILQRGDLPCGLYFIRLNQGNETIATEKIIITD